jgi:hypothetical protein
MGVTVAVIDKVVAPVAIHFVSAAGTHEKKIMAGESFGSFLLP